MALGSFQYNSHQIVEQPTGSWAKLSVYHRFEVRFCKLPHYIIFPFILMPPSYDPSRIVMRCSRVLQMPWSCYLQSASLVNRILPPFRGPSINTRSYTLPVRWILVRLSLPRANTKDMGSNKSLSIWSLPAPGSYAWNGRKGQRTYQRPKNRRRH